MIFVRKRYGNFKLDIAGRQCTCSSIKSVGYVVILDVARSSRTQFPALRRQGLLVRSQPGAPSLTRVSANSPVPASLELQLTAVLVAASSAAPRQVVGRQVRIPLHRFQRFPSSQLLQELQRRAALHIPDCPYMAQIVPAEIADAAEPPRVRSNNPHSSAA
jgi:hypothetical protein